jgi:hypothetical protein
MSGSVGRHRRARAIFESVHELTPQARAAAVANACGDDSEVRREVLGLLEAEERMGSFLENGVARVVGPDARQGDRIGPYEITGILASGGMGDVYRARDTTLGRDPGHQAHEQPGPAPGATYLLERGMGGFGRRHTRIPRRRASAPESVLRRYRVCPPYKRKACRIGSPSGLAPGVRSDRPVAGWPGAVRVLIAGKTARRAESSRAGQRRSLGLDSR